MGHKCKRCLIKEITCLRKQNKTVPKKLVLRLLELVEVEELLKIISSTSPIIGPYIQLIPDLLYPSNGSPLFKDFFLNIQYYNQGDYYNTYGHIFSDLTGGPYGMTQSASCRAIANYLNDQYKVVPEAVKDSIVVGKLLTAEAGESGYTNLSTLNSWLVQAEQNDIPYGGIMLWSSGYLNEQYPSDELNSETFKDVLAKYRVIYIGSGSSGLVYTADGESLYAQASDPDGSNARKALLGYAESGFNRIILAFWNYDSESDWVIDWSSIDKDAQHQLIQEIHEIGSDCKVMVSGGGANAWNIGPASGISGKDWGQKLAQYAVDNNLDGVDLDLEGAMLGVQWSEEQYQWLKDAVSAIAEYNSDLSVSFAPVAPLCANPN